MDKDYNIDELLKDINLADNLLKRRSNGILLSDRDIEVLNRYEIDYKKYNNLKMLMFDIEECLNEMNGQDCDDLELVSMDLAERDYYQNTKK